MNKDTATRKSDTYHHGNLKESLLQTALEMIDKEGIEAITLRELSARLGTSRSAIYRHFSGKDALMKQVINSGFKKLDLAVSPAFNDEQKQLLERFHDMGMAYITFAIENPNLYRLLFGPALSREREEMCEEDKPDLHRLKNGDSSQEVVEHDDESGFHKLAAIIIQGQQQQIFKPGDPVLIATAIWALLHGLSSLVIDGHVSVSDNVQAVYETNYKLLIEGIATP